MKPLFPIEQIAQVCHETNKHFCRTIGDFSQHCWQEAEQWQRDSAVAQVEYFISNPVANPVDMHTSWCAEKVSQGWVYGAEKDATKKTHPCLVPYHELSMEQRTKDKLFQGVVKSMCDLTE